MTTTCEVPKCGDDVHAKGYCVKHYYKMKRTGTLDPIKPGPKKPDSGCSVSDCERELYAKGYCRKHYSRVQRTGTTEALRAVVRGADRTNEDGHIWCSKCRQFVPLPRRTPLGWCDECLRENGRVRRYGLTEEQFQAMIVSQDNLCPVCNKPDPDTVDHDHSCCPGRETCGECVRGILHRQCNAALGTVEPNLDRIVGYLGKFRDVTAENSARRVT